MIGDIEWFKPTAGSLTLLSSGCIECVLLAYLISLKVKTTECYLLIFIYTNIAAANLGDFVVKGLSRQSPYAGSLTNMFFSLGVMSIIWCSYRFYKNLFHSESYLILSIFGIAYGLLIFRYLHDRLAYKHVLPFHRLEFFIVTYIAVLLSSINYLRKLRFFSDLASFRQILNKIVNPISKLERILSGYFLSLFLYSVTWVNSILTQIGVIGDTFILDTLISVTVTTWVAVVFFNYTPQKTSLETKLIGLILFIILSVLTIIPLLIFGSENSPITEQHILGFAFLIPLSTIAIVLFVPLLFRLTVLKHLNNVVAGVKAVKEGNFNTTIQVEVNDEVGQLSESFNHMMEALRQRTEQLDTMRESIATDFHDQTGNMLSAITRQASLLKEKFTADSSARPIVESIIKNSSDLYASSKDFLWQLNHESDDPVVLLDYLTAYGQQYYNQFDIAFSSVDQPCDRLQLAPLAAFNLVLIFKELMTNVIKHAEANEVVLIFSHKTGHVVYTLQDNGSWKPANPAHVHYGISNMQRRCQKNNFEFSIDKLTSGTMVSVKVPVQPFK